MSDGVLAQSAWTTLEAPMMTGMNGWIVEPIITVGESVGGYYLPGVPDGLGAFALDAGTVRVLVNHEFGEAAGPSYEVTDGTGGTLVVPSGGRVSYVDIDRATRGVVAAGVAIERLIDRQGQITNAPVGRLCAGTFFPADPGGTGLRDAVFLSGEENGNGTIRMLDPATGEQWAVPALGRGNWENGTFLKTGSLDHVAVLLGDDTLSAPLYLYVGIKEESGSFLARNGLVGGRLFVWISNTGEANALGFHGDGKVLEGHFSPITYYDPTKANVSGYDQEGYVSASRQRQLGFASGAFAFTRIEDLAMNPVAGNEAAFAATGGSVGDVRGTLYRVAIDFSKIDGETLPATLTILLDADDHASEPIYRPDNVDWAEADRLFVQEDGSAPNSILEIGMGQVSSLKEVARMDQTAIPVGQGVASTWESSGLVDISLLFGEPLGTLKIGCVQAHGLVGGIISTQGLVEGGQLFFLRNLTPNPMPEIDSLGEVDHRLGESFWYQISATQTPLTYGVASLPPGLILDEATGVITGAPLLPGRYTMVLSAQNAFGAGTLSLHALFRPSKDQVPDLTLLQIDEGGQVLEANGLFPGVPYTLRRWLGGVDEWIPFKAFDAEASIMTLSDPAPLTRAFYRLDF